MHTEEELIIYSHSNILPHSEITGSDSSTYETREHVSISRDDKMHWEGKWPWRVCKKKNLDRRELITNKHWFMEWNTFFFFLVRLGDFFFSQPLRCDSVGDRVNVSMVTRGCLLKCCTVLTDYWEISSPLPAVSPLM